MQLSWFILAAALIGILFVIGWLLLLLGSRTRRPEPNNTPLPPPDSRNADIQLESQQQNIVDLAAFRQRKNARGKEHYRSQQTEPVLRKERLNETHQKAAPGTIRAIPLSKSGEMPSQPRQQKCSYCKKEAPRLTFYANNDGSLVGVCKECEPIAKRQDLLPL